MKKLLLYASIMAVFNFTYTKIVRGLPESYGILITLIVLFVPVILFFAYRELMIHRWNYKLPIGKVVLSGFVIVLLGAVILASLHWLNEQFFHLMGDNPQRSWPQAVWGFIEWYFIFGLIGIPLAYGALHLKVWFQNRKKLK